MWAEAPPGVVTLDEALRRAIRRCADPEVRDWLKAMLRGERAGTGQSGRAEVRRREAGVK
jgi:hypothetical protein